MSKPITISLQNLNSLYFKFINQFVLQYLPKDIYNDVVNLLSLKSAVETYRFLDKLLSSTQEKKGLSFGEDKRALTLGQERKGAIQVEEKKENQKRSQSYQQKSNASNQGSISYVDRDDFKYQSDFNTIKKPPTLLKRTQTYQSPQKPSNINYESYNFGQARLGKQDTTTNKQILNSLKSPLNNLSQAININVVKHDFDTVSEKHITIGITSGKRESKDGQEIRSNFNTVGDSYSFKGNKDRDSKEKSDQNLSTNNGYRKTEFSKTYSIKQTEPKMLTTSANNLTTTPNTNYQQSSATTIVNRLRFQNLIKQTKEIFSENAKKIARYEKISTDTVGQKTQKSSNDSTTPFSPESGNSYTYMYKKY